MPRLAPTLRSATLRSATLALALCGVVGGCSDASADLVGTWRQADVREDGITTRYTFFADGRAQIVVRPPAGAAQSYGARYRVDADTLLTLQDAQGAERFTARVRGDTLRLHNPVTDLRTTLFKVGG